MRGIVSLDVRCPECGSMPGVVCWRLDGSAPTGPHVARRRRAREEQLRLHPEHVTGQQPLFAGPRRQPRRGRG